MSTNPVVSCAAVIVAYNNEDTIAACLASLFARSSVTMTAVVVDNSPGHGTAAAVAAYQAAHAGHKVFLIRRPDNPGFAAGCNLGARGRDEDFLLFLNPDTELQNDAPGLLIDFLQKNPRAKTAGPQFLGEDGQAAKTCRNLPSPFGIFCDATGLDAWLGRYKLTRFNHREARPVEQIIGAGMMLRRGDFEALGGFDERFFIYFEEVDLCKRILDAGGQVWFRPEARVLHIGGVSCEASPTVGRMLGILRRSRAQYFAKHFGVTPQILTLTVTVGEAVGKAAALALMSLARPARAAYYRAKARGFLALLTEWSQTR